MMSESSEYYEPDNYDPISREPLRDARMGMERCRMNKLRKAEAAEMALAALEELTGTTLRFIDKREALRQALTTKHECETCAAKRKRLTDAGLLKSPLRNVEAIDTSSKCVDETEKREHEPVGEVLNVQWMSSGGGWEIGFHSKRRVYKGDKLYTAPPSKPWQSLTDEEIENFDLPDKPTVKEFVRFIEAALRSKNNG